MKKIILRKTNGIKYLLERSSSGKFLPIVCYKINARINSSIGYLPYHECLMLENAIASYIIEYIIRRKRFEKNNH